MQYNNLMIESDINDNINNLKEKQNEKSLYQIKLITKQYNEMIILIKKENSKLNFICLLKIISKYHFKIAFH